MSDRDRRPSSRRRTRNQEAEESSERESGTEQPSDSWSDVGDTSPVTAPRRVETDQETDQDNPGSEEDESIVPIETEDEQDQLSSATMVDTATDALASMGITLMPEGQENELETTVKPINPKENWHLMDANTKRKIFDKIVERQLGTKLSLTKHAATEDDILTDTALLDAQLTRVHQHFKENDLDSIFKILKFDAQDPRNKASHSVVDMLETYGTVSPHDVAEYNKFLQKYGDKTKMPWLDDQLNLATKFLENNSDDELSAKVTEEYLGYDVAERGGNLWYALTFRLIYHRAEEDCMTLMNHIPTLQLRDEKGEDVVTFVSKIRAGLSFLARAHCIEDPHDGTKFYKYVRTDLPQLLLQTFQTSSTPEFNKVFEMLSTMNTLYRSSNQDSDGDTSEGTTLLDSMAKDTDVVAVSEQILKHAQREYLRLVHLNKWLGVSTPGTSSFTAAERICFNCGEKGHLAGTCPQPRNQAAFERRMKAFREQHPGRGGRGPGSGRGRGPGRGGGRGGRGGGTSKFSPPTAEEGNKRIIDGKQMHWTPTANKGQGRWFPCDSKPQANMAGKPTESVKTAPSTGSETSALTTSTPTFPTQSTTMVADVSIDAARKQAQKAATLEKAKQAQAAYKSLLAEYNDM